MGTVIPPLVRVSPAFHNLLPNIQSAVPPRTIAIDGPAGSGKTVLGLWLAAHLRYAFLDTGALYRALTLAALRRGIDPGDEAGLVDIAQTVEILVEPPAHPADARGYVARIDGQDVTEALFAPDVNARVSTVAAHAAVREELLPLQRRIAARGGVVMVGRDIGTTVLPDAELKLYLTASEEERARRRWIDERGRGQGRALGDVLADLRQRDKIDASRESSPLRPASDSLEIATDGVPLEQVKTRVLEILATRAADDR